MAFSEHEEQMIAEYLITVSGWEFSFSKFDLRVLAKHYLDKSGKTIEVFKNNFPREDWAEAVIQRNSRSTRISRNIPSRRAKKNSPEGECFPFSLKMIIIYTNARHFETSWHKGT